MRIVGYLAAALTGMGLIGWINPAGDFPLNDDWQYAWPVKQLLEEGRLGFKGYFAPNILLQVLWGYLFCLPFDGFDYTYLRWSTLILAITGLWGLWRLTGAIGYSRQAQCLTTAALAFTPLYFVLSFSFMTDVPFLVLCLLTFLAYWQHLKTGRGGYLALAILCAIAAFLIRQPGLLLLPAMGLARLFISQDRQSLLLTIGLTGIALLSYLLLEKGIKPALGIDQNYVPVSVRYWEALVDSPRGFFTNQVKKAMQSLIFLGFFSMPFYPFLHGNIRRAGLYRFSMLFPILTINSLVFLFFWLRSEIFFPFGGNILDRGGLGPELLMDNITLQLSNTPEFPAFIFPILHGLAQLSISFLLALTLSQVPALRSHYRIFFLFLLLLNLFYLPLMSVFSYFDRYLLLSLLSLFVWLGFLISRSPPRRSAPLMYLPLLLMTVFTLLGAKDYMSWNRAKHQAYLYLEERGVGIKEMDAGYEYNGWYNFQPDWQIPAGLSEWWVESDRYVIAFGPVPGYRVITRVEYYRYLFARRDWIYVLERKGR